MQNKETEKSNQRAGRERTAGWQNIDHKENPGSIPIPTITGVEAAKDWVDNGSKL